MIIKRQIYGNFLKFHYQMLILNIFIYMRSHKYFEDISLLLRHKQILIIILKNLKKSKKLAIKYHI